MPSSISTARKDSQKPGCSRAQGSTATVPAAATAHSAQPGHGAPRLRSSTAPPSIQTVRCAGTPQPASSA
jgi:hypothetical protein